MACPQGTGAMSQSKAGVEPRQLIAALGEVSGRLRNEAAAVDAQARRETSYRGRHDAALKADQMRADAKVVEAAHELLKRAIS